MKRLLPYSGIDIAANKIGEHPNVLKIRLRRTGAKKQPRYRVVVAESRAPRDGAFVDVIGWYNPQADPAQVHVDLEKANNWLQRGAQPSERVAYLLKQANQPPAPEPAPEPAKPERRRRGAAGADKAASAEPSTRVSAEETPESESSAASTVTATTEPVETDQPESEGSAGATPA